MLSSKTPAHSSLPQIVKMLCTFSLSPIGDNAELQKRLAVHLTAKEGGGDSGAKENGGGDESGDGGEGKNQGAGALMEVIMAHEGEHSFVLSLSGRMVRTSRPPDSTLISTSGPTATSGLNAPPTQCAATSSKGELRKAYFLLR